MTTLARAPITLALAGRARVCPAATGLAAQEQPAMTRC